MRLAGFVLAILALVAGAAGHPSANLVPRILEILQGPPQKIPVPPVKAALLLCQSPGSENVNRDLVRAAGSPSVLMVSAHPDPKKWFAAIKNMLESYEDHLGSFVLDLGCPGALDLLQMANDTNMFRSPYRWLLIYPVSNETSMSLESCGNQAQAVLGDLAIFLDSEVVSMCRYGEDGQSGLIIEWHGFYFVRYPFKTELGSWEGGSEYSRIKWTDRASKPLAIRRANLMGLPVNCGFVLRFNESLQHLMDGVDTRKDTLTKFFYPILHNSVEMMNGTFQDKYTNSWGYPVNGTWNGMVGMQFRGEVDLSGLPAIMEHVRNTVLSFIAFRAPTVGTFLFRATPMSYEANLFALPFPDSLWAAAGGMLTLCFFLLYLVLSIEDNMVLGIPSNSPSILAAVPIQPLEQGHKPKPFLDPEPTEEEVNDDAAAPSDNRAAAVSGDGIQAKARLHGSWSDVLLLVFGAICQQGSPVEARTIPGRIVTISMLIGVIFLFTSYSASIVVLLQSTSNSIKNLDDLWKSRLPCGAEDVNYQRYLFTQLTGDARVGIHKKILKKNKRTKSGNNFMTLDAGMERLRKEHFAFHTLSTSMFPLISDTWLEHEKCALREIDNFYYPQNPYVSTIKFHPIVDMFRITLRKMHERGIRLREIGRIVIPKPKCTNPGSNFVSVSVNDCYFAMLILLSGIFASMFVLSMEHLAVYRLRKMRQRRVSALLKN